MKISHFRPQMGFDEALFISVGATKKYIHSLPRLPKKKKLTLKSNGFNDLEKLDARNSRGDHIKLDQYKQAKADLSSCGHRFYLLNQVFRASVCFQ